MICITKTQKHFIVYIQMIIKYFIKIFDKLEGSFFTNDIFAHH